MVLILGVEFWFRGLYYVHKLNLYFHYIGRRSNYVDVLSASGSTKKLNEAASPLLFQPFPTTSGNQATVANSKCLRTDLFHNDVKRGKRDVRRNLIGLKRTSIIAEPIKFRVSWKPRLTSLWKRSISSVFCTMVYIIKVSARNAEFCEKCLRELSKCLTLSQFAQTFFTNPSKRGIYPRKM